MNTPLVLATGNSKKASEIKEILKDVPVALRTLAEFAPMPEPVEDGTTFLANARGKAVHYARLLGQPCLADDTGLVVEALNGSPGVHSARYAGPKATDRENCAKLLREMVTATNRAAHFACVLVLAVPDGEVLSWEGRCDGEIITEGRGVSGFGYDPLFLLPEVNRTLAEIPLEEKGAFSHRGKALAQFIAEFDAIRKWLNERL
ncbi:XTP/dITP diphosphatase [Desulfobulbus alkaliphilus]|uniref:XTP/dITP diphosphatase n=1 Tax=Desulfobulbus alkaliphilus TaxID=869814 RepID=UPI001962387C|nr:XTP/dITP diphosphatase [Desulfobulbus alkaliphilus]MBM9536314.1 XTP/dITP diphosphatase [Desulfobulbus alkaliphilus]